MSSPNSKSGRAERTDAERIGSALAAGDRLRIQDHWPTAADRSAFDAFYTSILRHNRVDAQLSLRLLERIVELPTDNLSEIDRHRAHRLRAHALLVLGRAGEGAAVYHRVWDAFEALGRQDELIPTGIGLVLALAQTGEVEEVHAVSARVQRYMGPKDTAARARLLTNEANVYFLSCQYERAAHCYDRAWKALRRAGLEFDAAVAAYNLGHAWLCGGDPQRARPRLEEALATFERGHRRHQVLYAEFSLAVADMMEARWDGLRPRLRELQQRLEKLGDVRATAALLREQAEFLAALGALGPAEEMAGAAQEAYAKAELHRDAAHTSFLHGRLLAAMGRTMDARARYSGASATFEHLGDRLTTHRVGVELAAVHMARGEFESAQALLAPALRILEREGGRSDVVRCRRLMAELHLHAGHIGRGLEMAQLAYRDAMGYPARTERPWIALVNARGHARREDRRVSRRWLRSAVDEMERTHQDLRSAAPLLSAAPGRRRFLRDALELALEPGGAGSGKVALDVLSRIEGLEIATDTLPKDRKRWLKLIAGLRDRLLSAPQRGSTPERLDALDAALERDVARSSRAARVTHREDDPTVARNWIPRLSGAQCVYYHRMGDDWAAFVVDPRGRVRHVHLPAAEMILRDKWFSMRMLLERAAHLELSRRGPFLKRTEAEAEDSLAALRARLWEPLGLAPGEVIVIPQGALHGVPLEAMANISGAGEHIVSRLPHPLFLRRGGRGQRGRALLLHDGNPGPSGEARRVGRQLRRGGLTVRTGSRRDSLLRHAGGIDLLHVAAHGSYHRHKWLLNGIRLSDGWLGFERLGGAGLRNALLFFGSCDSGLNHEAPGAELGGWSVAGLRAGARELILALWKIDDQAAEAFSRAFYRRWLQGDSVAVAAHEARGELREGMPHPFSWASFLNVG